MAMRYFENLVSVEANAGFVGVKRSGRNYYPEEGYMATAKGSIRSTPAKPAAPAKAAVAAKIKTPVKAASKPEPAARVAAAKAAPRKAAPQAVAPKAATPKAAVSKAATVRAKKPNVVPPEQRRNYIEMAAYYIAERRGFAPGNPLEDWVQAEAEIDRLLAEGRVGG